MNVEQLSKVGMSILCLQKTKRNVRLLKRILRRRRMHPEFERFGDPIEKLTEELAELIVALMKVKRFGWRCANPLIAFTHDNLQQVESEILDVRHAIENIEELIKNEKTTT
jgi:Na+/phosphate symporter